MFRRKPKDEGINLGLFLHQARPTKVVRYRGGKHLITIGPNGSFKGMGLIVPNLAELRRSILVIDPKGEALSIVGRRRAKLGRLVVINPFGVFADKFPHMKSHGFNPLACLDPKSDNFADDATGIAEALVRIEGSDPHWSNSAQELVAALVCWEVIKHGREATLGHVRHMLTEPFAKLGDQPIGLFKTILDMLESGYPALQSKAGRFTQATREIHAIVSTAITQTRFLDSPPVRRDLAQGTFDFADMKREIVSVFMVLPADRLQTHANLLRLVVTSALRALLQSPPSETLPPVLFLLDEFAQLGYLPPIENAMGIARGFGIQLWPFLQDFNQLKALYKDRWQTFIANRGVLTAFGPKDQFTAEYLSKLGGEQTKSVESIGFGDDGNGNMRGSLNRSPHGFPLFRPEDLMGMSSNQMLCWVDPVKFPFLTHVPGYWETPFGRGLDGNPYYRRPAA